MSKSQSLLKKQNDHHPISNAKRTELIFNAYVLFQSRQPYAEPFRPELLIKWLNVIEAEVNQAHSAVGLGGNNG